MGRGANWNGQLGNGTINDSAVPVATQIPAGVTITSIAAGAGHSLALDSTGAVWAWGYNVAGQLGDGTYNDSTVPVATQIPAGVTITAIAAGNYHSLALDSTGAVWAWGYNSYGQLGDGTTVWRNTPVATQIPGGVTITGIAGGYLHSLALDSTGGAWAWGANWAGQLGNGTNSDSVVPVAVQLPPSTILGVVAAGDTHSLAITQLISTTTTLTSSPNPSVLGQPVTFTATVTPDSPTTATPTGTVSFYDGATLLGTVPLNASGTATFTTTGLGVGAHDITAVYSGDSTFLPSTSTPLTQTVTPGYAVVVLNVSTSSTAPGEPVTFVAGVVPPPGTDDFVPTGTVTFYEGATPLGPAVPLINGTAVLTTTSLATGTHNVTAVYSGDPNYIGPLVSSPVTVVIATPAPAPTTLTASPAVIKLNLSTGQYYIPTLRATLTDSTTGTGLPGKTITFTANPVTGPVTLGSATTDATGTATLTNVPVSATLITTTRYTATFAGDATHAPATATAPLTFQPI
ncbi:Ig-like domain repeat protein [Saccharomonospora xinjiangensis]|uniref:Ig-like domain repeat protein n=1 Tax=Saccharomonospora xinjiangensis TaxID=75294 RepID=UPI0010C4B6D9|nr:Ig-like domain repeat protein [Saccharomonospora xinjiangensis]QBQ61718.1 Regulator of chromosome condensation (RCC1) repeat protein [Saccharomonospora xinjiangensis]